jgi:hypothetical protein
MPNNEAVLILLVALAVAAILIEIIYTLSQ